MTVYADSSALFKLYVAENHSSSMAALAEQDETFFILNGLHELEVRNAFRLMVFRGEINADAAMNAFAALDADVSSPLYRAQSLDFGRLTKAAERMSAATTVQKGGRALDLLHVAAARLIDCDAFVTFDQRQREIAAVAGLTLFDFSSLP